MKKTLLTLAAIFMATTMALAQNLVTGLSIDSTWAPDTPPTASIADDGSIDITINQWAGWQWGGQVKVLHDVDFEAGKHYTVSMQFVASADCGGITLKIDDNTGMIYENQTIDLEANTPLIYKKVGVAGIPGNNHIMVLDFGWVGAGIDINVSNIVIEEVETDDAAATASSGNPAAAIDGDMGTRWESEFNDDQWWMINYKKPHAFNTVKIVWEGAYAKSFRIEGSNDGENFTVLKTIEDQTLSGFPYTQIIDLGETVSYQYVKFVGVARATGYGYSFWEFETYVAEPDVLTSLTFTAAASICKVGETVALTATPKNQYGAEMAAEVTYTVTPETAGTVADGVYTAAEFGSATITATCGTLSKSVEIFNYEGENVALNKEVTVTEGGFEGTPGHVLNNGLDFDVWQGDPTEGTSGNLDVTCQFVIDLAGEYDLNLVTIKFEGACSDAWKLETSTGGEDWKLAYEFAGSLGINAHTDYLYGENLKNADNVGYIRFTSTKNSTQWGMKIYEIQAFGTPAEAAPEVETYTGHATTIEDWEDEANIAPAEDLTVEIIDESTLRVNAWAGVEGYDIIVAYDEDWNITSLTPVYNGVAGTAYTNGYAKINTGNGSEYFTAYLGNYCGMSGNENGEGYVFLQGWMNNTDFMYYYIEWPLTAEELVDYIIEANDADVDQIQAWTQALAAIQNGYPAYAESEEGEAALSAIAQAIQGYSAEVTAALKAAAESWGYTSPLTDDVIEEVNAMIAAAQEAAENTTGIESIAADAEGAIYFDVNGRNIATPAAGNVVIKVVNGKATKVLVK